MAAQLGLEIDLMDFLKSNYKDVSLVRSHITGDHWGEKEDEVTFLSGIFEGKKPQDIPLALQLKIRIRKVTITNILKMLIVLLMQILLTRKNRPPTGIRVFLWITYAVSCSSCSRNSLPYC